MRSRDGVKAVSLSLLVLGLAAAAQTAVFIRSGSVALLADLIHNLGNALTPVPLGIAFFLRSFRGEKPAGLAVVAAIFISASVALYETVQRFIHPHTLHHLWALAAAGVIGFVGNEIAAKVRLRAGRRLRSPALVADGNHARVDGYVRSVWWRVPPLSLSGSAWATRSSAWSSPSSSSRSPGTAGASSQPPTPARGSSRTATNAGGGFHGEEPASRLVATSLCAVHNATSARSGAASLLTAAVAHAAHHHPHHHAHHRHAPDQRQDDP